MQGAIILCGGKSSRMGRDKATLPFGPELMLQRVVRLVSGVVDPAKIVVVAAEVQSLPPLPVAVTITRDPNPDRGPLEGLGAGLRELSGRIDVAYATACDVPLLVPAFVAQMFAWLGNHQVAVPRDAEHFHPLAAVYRTNVLPHIERLLAAGRLSPRFLFDEVDVLEVAVERLRLVDPPLNTLMNLNYPADYRAALAAAGFESPFGLSGDTE